MNKSILSMGLICAAAFTLTNCTKDLEPQAPVKEGVPFEITASINDTKTTNDGLNTSWVKGDAISVFHTEANSKAYGTNDEFTCTSISENSFSGTLTKGLEAGKSYDWYAIYPYSKHITTPAATTGGYITIGGTSQTQTGNSNMSHIAGKACPMYGIATGVSASTTPSISMNHLTSVVKIHLTNKSGADLSVNTIAFTAPEYIVGTYFIDFVSSPVVYTESGPSYVSKTATLNVNSGEAISNGASADFYIAIKPFTAATGSNLSISVNGAEKEKTLESDVTFTAGKIKTLNYTVSAPIVDYVTLPWSEDFSEDLGKYTLVNGSTGSVTKTYDQNNAGGTAPELLVAKSNGSFSAKVKAVEGAYRLTFKSNNPSRLGVSVDNASIAVAKSSDTEYFLTIPNGVEFFNLTFTNIASDNARLDDIELKLDTRTQLSTPVATAKLSSEANNAIEVSWGEVTNAASYVVTATPTSGTEVSKTVDAPATSCTLTGLEYETEYSISVVAKPSDEESYKNSESSLAVKVSTGVNVGGPKNYTLTINTSDFNSTSYAANNNDKTTAAVADDASTINVTWNSYQVMLSSGVMQWQKDKGYIYNKTDLGKIISVTVTSSAGTFTTYYGDSVQPSSSTEVNGGYFKIKVGNATGKTSKVEVVFEK